MPIICGQIEQKTKRGDEVKMQKQAPVGKFGWDLVGGERKYIYVKLVRHNEKKKKNSARAPNQGYRYFATGQASANGSERKTENGGDNEGRRGDVPIARIFDAARCFGWQLAGVAPRTVGEKKKN